MTHAHVLMLLYDTVFCFLQLIGTVLATLGSLS